MRRGALQLGLSCLELLESHENDQGRVIHVSLVDAIKEIGQTNEGEDS